MESLQKFKGPEYADVENRAEILNGVLAGRRIRFLTYALPDSMERQLDFVIAAILKKYDKVHLQSTVYTCLKELIVNGTRANARMAWFEEKNIDASDENAVKSALATIKNEMSESWIREYGTKASKRGYEVRVDFEYNELGMRIWVWNDAKLTAEDEKRIRHRFREGMAFDDIVTFYMKQGDQSQGEGMGLVMSLLLLKGEHIDPALLRVGSTEGKTMARLEIPFMDGFVSVRGPNPHGYDSEPVGMRLDFRAQDHTEA